MNKKIYVCIIIILAILLLITGTYSIVHYFFNYNCTNWFKKSVKNDSYIIIGEEIGDTFWNSDSKAIITIKHNDRYKFLASFETRIENEGNDLTEENYDIEYNDEYIKISLINHDGSICSVYRFYYSDFS